MCNHENNNENCNYDGGDCCLTDCLECGCPFIGVITSTNFLAGANYNNSLNMTWLIQVPAGQNIEISWQSFDVEAEQSCK